MSFCDFEYRIRAISHAEEVLELKENLTATNFTKSFKYNLSKMCLCVLCLYWNLKFDAFQVRAISSKNTPTKHQLLSIGLPTSM